MCGPVCLHILTVLAAGRRPENHCDVIVFACLLTTHSIMCVRVCWRHGVHGCKVSSICLLTGTKCVRVGGVRDQLVLWGSCALHAAGVGAPTALLTVVASQQSLLEIADVTANSSSLSLVSHWPCACYMSVRLLQMSSTTHN